MKQGIYGALLLSQAASLSRLYCTHMLVDLDLLVAVCAHSPRSTRFTILHSICARKASKHTQTSWDVLHEVVRPMGFCSEVTSTSLAHP